MTDDRDFITGIRASNQTLVLIHEANLIEIVRDMQIADRKIIRFESNVYDTAQVGKILVASNKNMPVRNIISEGSIV